jgi:hypothetical protein
MHIVIVAGLVINNFARIKKLQPETDKFSKLSKN